MGKSVSSKPKSQQKATITLSFGDAVRKIAKVADAKTKKKTKKK